MLKAAALEQEKYSKYGDGATNDCYGGGGRRRPSRSPADGTMDRFGLAWDSRRGRWISLVYRYVFPTTSFQLPDHHHQQHQHQRGRLGRFEFGPCKQHHMMISQSPFKRRHHPQPYHSNPHGHVGHGRRRVDVEESFLSSRLADEDRVDEALLTDFVGLDDDYDNDYDYDYDYGDDGDGDAHELDERSKVLPVGMEEFLCTPVLDDQMFDLLMTTDLVMPSSPPPPLFSDLWP